jgi:hypothetical protein
MFCFQPFILQRITKARKGSHDAKVSIKRRRSREISNMRQVNIDAIDMMCDYSNNFQYSKD